jgi:hypothetical protein
MPVKRFHHSKNQVTRLERERARLVAALIASEPLTAASLSLVKRTCGRPTCHCAKVPSHQAWVLKTQVKGTQRCQVVRQADIDEVRARVARYKDLRARLKRLEAIGKEEIALLRGLVKQRHVPYD